ncbi:MAG TPA: C25 family cysteine peptidase [Puia sp.]|nr:C25 family cysteine peptidase [Puia sp.]
MKNFFTIALLLATLGLCAQNYNNEWIDYSKTYYKFKVGATGLYRIPQSVLATAGLGGQPAQNFQLFRNGQEVPIYTSVASGVLGSSDYVEFWGQINDGAPDQPLYRSASYQHTQHWSLETDTAVYFLTVNTSGNAFHFINTNNDTTGTLLAAEPYFMHKAAGYFKQGINPGFAQVVGEYIYSSSYDIGEFWATSQISPGAPFTDNQSNLYVYGSGPDASIRFGMTGCADNARTVRLSVNNTVLADTVMNSFFDLLTSRVVPLSLIGGGAASVQFTNNSTVSTDRMVASFYELDYPRQFNFGGQPNFYFELPAKSAGYFLKINNFGISGSIPPVLYDITNGLRYTAIVGPGSTLSFLLGGTVSTRKMVLVNEDPSTVQTVTGLTSKTFVNFSNSANQGNYIIISHPTLYTGSSGNNPVADYKTYRSSAAGGSFNAQMYDINELVDQFAFGIKKHPLSIQNFLRYARAVFAAKPQYVLLIGHGMTYSDYNYYAESLHDPLADRLNLVPTFGAPASDNKISAANGVDAVPVTPIGRLSVVSGPEIENYLNKLKDYEQVQANASNTIAGRLWMKNVLHLTGASEPYLGAILCNYMNSYAQIISDTLVGANVSTLCDGNASQVSQVPGGLVASLFSSGFSMLNYFGHSSNTTLGYNLDDPKDYNNIDKYPVFYLNGCDAGDFFIYDNQRFGPSQTLSEKYVLAKDRGSIAVIASTSFGIVNYLNILLYGLYNLIDQGDYGKSIGIIQKDAIQALVNVAPGDYFARLHAEQMTTHGDPFLKLNQGATDYDIEASQVQINPSFISISNSTFDVKARFYNLGKVVSDSVIIQVQRTYPNGTTALLLNKKIKGIRYSDSIDLTVPIVGTRDKGQNKITVTINPGNLIPEVTYLNNSVTTNIYIYQDEATPVYPYNYSIINTATSKLIASTSNPMGASQQYAMELDTTQLFNSPGMVTKFLVSSGGELEFDPGITFRDSTVYYWRVGLVPSTTGGQYIWDYASFIYIDPARSSTGFNQSHYFQHLGSATDSMTLTADRLWTFGMTSHNIYQRNTVYPDGGTHDDIFSVAVDGNLYIQSACVGASLIFNVFDPVTLNAWKNVDANGNNLYLSGSGPANCNPTRNWNIEFSYMDVQDRYKMMRFMDSIPNGFYVTVKNIPFDYQSGNTYAADWHADTALYGANNSLYNRLVNAGFAGLDSINVPRAFVFIYKKGDLSFTPQYRIGVIPSDELTLSTDCPSPFYTGIATSPKFGPAKKWNSLHWRGHDLTSPVTDTVGLQLIGVDTLGNSTNLYNLSRSIQDFDISAVDPKQYPYLQLKLTTSDSVHAKPFQLDYWRVNYTPVPEGALAPNIFLKSQDSVVLGQPLEFAIAFKNVSPYAFDSMRIQMYILDRNNIMHTIQLPRRKPLISGDTLTLDYVIDTKAYTGANTIYINFNPNNDQPEQYLFNNFLYKTFYVKGDSRNPLMDVTFDNVHILNNDIVSAKPHIQIKLKSQSQYLLLTDTSLITVQVKFPDGSLHNYGFNSDTLRFTPATSANNNEATVDFTPAFTQQYNATGDNYELIVSGKDALGNTAGTTPYRIGFKIITKAMISNLLNYPNPFTTSTAFVFTITGSDVPQNIKIQILTITGKIVREITKDELGPLHVGRNITEFKWNATDMYGQRLANGVYLYHVVTNLNGKSLDKYTASGDNTDKYFNNGYGKMYLMK